MCQCSNCNGITLFSGTDGVGIQSITNNNNGTFTILLTNGTTWTSEDLTGPQGATGNNGTNGTNGINAFKFVKDFSSNLDGGTCTISRTELTNCSSVPNGCLFESITAGFTNLQVQVWLRNNDPSPSGNWYLALPGSTLASVTINSSTGLITVTLGGGSTNVLARVVVIA